MCSACSMPNVITKDDTDAMRFQVSNCGSYCGTQRGMPPWGPVLGTRKISEVVAYVLSHHEPGEPIEIVNSPAAGMK